jgi:hypothetical protein
MYDMRTKFRQWRTCVSLLKAETHQHRVVYFENVFAQFGFLFFQRTNYDRKHNKSNSIHKT